jgi:predicted RNase H-like nuclease (RuvC/YqgF family)
MRKYVPIALVITLRMINRRKQINNYYTKYIKFDSEFKGGVNMEQADKVKKLKEVINNLEMKLQQEGSNIERIKGQIEGIEYALYVITGDSQYLVK